MRNDPLRRQKIVKKTEKKTRSTWKIIVRRVLLILCGTVLGVNVYLANARSLVGNQLPMPFGVGAAIVLSGSMEPTFYTGDLIVVRECESVAVDDIVVYQDGGSLVVHRVIALEGDTVTTQGDANNAPDEPIPLSAVKGRVLFWIPHGGDVMTAIKSPIGTICLVAAAIALVEIPHRKDKQKDDEDRQKLIDEIRKLKDEL